jgi:hypothetical protein
VDSLRGGGQVSVLQKRGPDAEGEFAIQGTKVIECGCGPGGEREGFRGLQGEPLRGFPRSRGIETGLGMR